MVALLNVTLLAGLMEFHTLHFLQYYIQLHMKTLLSLILFVISFGTGTIFAQSNDKIIITGSRFTYPLLNKWILEFNKEYPDIKFHVIARGNVGVDSAHLVINAHKLRDEEIKGGTYVIDIARYALLPVANVKNPALHSWNKFGIKSKDFKKLFFQKYDILENAQNDKLRSKAKDKLQFKPTIYTRAQKACATISFARNYGFEQQDILGKLIGGDDHHLISAIEKDTNGITYNNLGFIYDLKSRTLKNSLAIIPIDFNNNEILDPEEQIYQNLDQLIQKLEAEPDLATVEYVNLSYAGQVVATNKNVKLFLDWVLSKGQKFNHDLGFLDFDPRFLAKQKEILLTSINEE